MMIPLAQNEALAYLRLGIEPETVVKLIYASEKLETESREGLCRAIYRLYHDDNITWSEMARNLGVSSTAVENWACQKSKPSQHHRGKIKTYLRKLGKLG